MNLKKVTIRIVFTLLAVIALGSMIASCSNEEFEGPRKTLARRDLQNDVENSVYMQPDMREINIPLNEIGGHLPVRIHWPFGKIFPTFEVNMVTVAEFRSAFWNRSKTYPYILDSNGDTIQGPLTIEDVNMREPDAYWLPQTLSADMHSIHVGFDVNYTLKLKITRNDCVRWGDTDEYQYTNIQSQISGLRITDNPNN